MRVMAFVGCEPFFTRWVGIVHQDEAIDRHTFQGQRHAVGRALADMTGLRVILQVSDALEVEDEIAAGSIERTLRRG